MHQAHFDLNVWIGILKDWLIGFATLLNQLTGTLYLEFLRNTVKILGLNYQSQTVDIQLTFSFFTSSFLQHPLKI